MLEITNARYLDGYKVRVCFNTGESGVVDLGDALWGPMFEPLRDPNVFKRFTVSDVLHTICWENDADFAPEFIHGLLTKQSSASQTAAGR